MSHSPTAAQRSPWAEFQRGVLRERALVALFDAGHPPGFARWVMRWYAFVVFVSYAVAILLARGADRTAEIQSVVHAALVALSWVVGALAALAAARALSRPPSPSSDALGTLALARGYSARSLLRARTLSVALRVARLVGLPGVLLVGLGLARGAAPIWALAVAPAVIVYASVLGLALALLALFSAQLSPSRPRAMLACLVLAPLLLAQAFPGFPSPVGGLSWLLAQLLNPGVALT